MPDVLTHVALFSIGFLIGKYLFRWLMVNVLGLPPIEEKEVK